MNGGGGLDYPPECAPNRGSIQKSLRTYNHKRAADIIISSIILIFIAPLLLLIFIGIKIDSPGPVLFSQPRRGKGGETFRIYKFRTMFMEQNDELCTVQSRPGDPRVTRFGSFLRGHSLDELPQLFNVLRGEMSLVGPRPHALGTTIHGMLLPALSSRYMLRYAVAPGITGWAQIKGRRGILNVPEDLTARLEDDLYYIEHWSLLLDLRILFLTVSCVFHDPLAF
jgi:lipopolysaccharide/colanic/teichoic acid biosynthesis glycosyltransferase